MAVEQELKRSLSLPVVALYGLGNILGAGIYVLIGKVAGEAGMNVALAFIVAMITAAFTAFSYMELSSRYPVSASVSVYLYEAFKKRRLSVAVGLALVAGGITSAAALSQGFAGYLNSFMSVPVAIGSVGLLIVLGLLALKGIGESAKIAALFTIIEIIGLLIIIWVGRHALGDINVGELVTIDPAIGVSGIIAGAFLAFYAFIGFEDLVNVAEEAKDPRRNIPFAILFSLIASTVLYLCVAIVAVTLVSPAELANSSAPLTLVFERSGEQGAVILSAIAMAAAINGIIVQIVMGSRILYGLSRQGWLHAKFATVHPKTKTPVAATLVILGLMILGTVLLPLVSLAQLTSFMVLSIFMMIHIALIVIKRRPIAKPKDIIAVPTAVPYIGTLLCFGTIAYQVYAWL